MKKFNDGSIFNIAGPCVIVVWYIFDWNVVKFEVAASADQRIHGFASRFGGKLHQFTQLVIFCNNPIYTHLGCKFDFFGRFLISGISSCNNKPIIAFAKNHNPVCLANFGVKKFFGKPERINRIKIQQGCAKDC